MEDQTDLKEGLEESLKIREMHQNYAADRIYILVCHPFAKKNTLKDSKCLYCG